MNKENLLFITKKETIKKAIIKIKKNGTRTVVVVDKKKHFFLIFRPDSKNIRNLL